MLPRRHLLLWSAAFCAGPRAWAGEPLRIAAAWRSGTDHHVGVLRRQGDGLEVEATLALPSRPHALQPDGLGGLLIASRRPGDWLLRWRPADGRTQWCWIEPDRCFNGHLLASRDGRRLFTTETDLANGQGLLGVRDAITLDKLAEWPTHGMDPHALLHEPDGAALVVANGGIPARQETGRMKIGLDAMDSSLVRLDVHDGRLRGQWRLADARLSLRHLAWSRPAPGQRPVLGIALQAEHDDDGARAAAPVLARFNGVALQACALPQGLALAGYGGDIAADAGGFAVSCPRADTLAFWDADGRWRARQRHAQACALAGSAQALWAGGAAALREAGTARTLALPAAPPMRLDNHAAWLRGPGLA